MTTIVFHNDLLSIGYLAGSCGLDLRLSLQPVLDLLVCRLSRLLCISENTVKLQIPAFDYNPFSSFCISPTIESTKFGLASLIYSRLPRNCYDILFDPVFKYITYPGSGLLMNPGKSSYSPFTSCDLTKIGYLAFTSGGFQPTHIIEIENRFFGVDHPYRRHKLFKLSDHDSRPVEFNYMVRPRDDLLINYDLDQILNMLKSSGHVLLDDESGFWLISYLEFANLLFRYLTDDRLCLLTGESRLYVERHLRQNGRLPKSLF